MEWRKRPINKVDSKSNNCSNKYEINPILMCQLSHKYKLLKLSKIRDKKLGWANDLSLILIRIKEIHIITQQKSSLDFIPIWIYYLLRLSFSTTWILESFKLNSRGSSITLTFPHPCSITDLVKASAPVNSKYEPWKWRFLSGTLWPKFDRNVKKLSYLFPYNL